MVMQKINWKLLTLSASLAVTAIFQMGYTNAYPNTAISSFRRFMNESFPEKWKMSHEHFEWAWSAVLAMYFIGFASGSLFSASIADRIGRRYSLLLGTTGSFISACVALLAVTINASGMFALSRLIMSFSAAISMNSLILLFQESSPSHMRGLISFNAEMAFVLTNLVGGLFGMQSVFGSSLTGLISISLLPSIASIALVVYIQESPKFLFLKKNDIEEASRSLRFYQGVWEDDEKAAVFDEYKLEKEETGGRKPGSIFDIWNDQPTRRGFLLGFATMQLTISIWPILFYSTDFLMDVGFTSELSENVSTTMLFVSTISTVIGMLIVEQIPRKWLLIGTASVNVSALLGYALCAIFSKSYEGVGYGCVACLILHGISYSIALGPIAWFITSELVPISCRAAAQSLVLFANHFVAMVITFFTFPFYKTIGPLIIVYFFVIPGVISILTLIIFLPETKDRHMNEIVDELRDAKSRRERSQAADAEESVEMKYIE